MSVHTRARRTRSSGKSSRPLTKEKSIPWRKVFLREIRKHSEGGLVLRGCRSKADITQKKLASALSISQHHISEMENGKRPIGKEMAKRFAAFFKTDYRLFL